MRRSLLVCLTLVASVAAAQGKKNPREADLGKKSATTIDKSLAGDISRKKEKDDDVPSLSYDQFRLGVELQVASKRREQIGQLEKLLSLDPPDAANVMFQLSELYREESKFFEFEANRKDDDLIKAMNRNDAAGQTRAKAEKAELEGKAKQTSKKAEEQYTKIIQRYPDFERMDEVLFFLGQLLMERREAKEEKKALSAYKRLIEKFPKSKYLPDVYLAFGDYFFNNSKGARKELEKALEAYKRAAEFTESQGYAYAIYKQGWCYFNMADYAAAKDKFKTVVLYGELAGAAATERDGGKSGKSSLVRAARGDYVKTYAREGDVAAAKDDFSKVATKPEDRFTMMKQLADLYYNDGKDREAAITFNQLIKEKPLSPEAPGFQAKIVDCVLRMGKKDRTVAQVRKLVKITKDVEASGVIKDDKDKKLLAEANELAERTLSNLAVTWHNEARKTRDEETFKFADAIYGDYLTLFPDNPKAYDMRFFWAELLNDNLNNYEKAATNYTLVVLQDAKLLEAKDDKGNPKPGKPGKWLTNAAYNAVLAYDEVVKAAEEKGALKPPDTGDIKKPITIPEPRKGLLESCERYLKYLPKGEKRVEISFKAANIYYRYNHFDEAVKRFSDIALNHPDHKFENGERAGEVAANLVLDSYNLQKDFAKVNEWARKFYANDKLAQGKFREDLSKLIEQSSFALVAQLEEKKQFAKAAEAYLNFVKDFPQTTIADQALYNASVDYFKAKQLDKAIEVRQNLISKYPRSRFVPDSIYANAEALEAIGDFEQAASTYELYVKGFERSQSEKGAPKKAKKGKDSGEEKKEEKQKWEEAKAQVALFNAATYREGLGQYKQALKNRELYLTLWPKTKDAEQIYLSIVALHEKNGAYGKALKMLEDYERDNIRSPSKYLTAEGRIVGIYEKKLRRAKDTARLYTRILEHYEKLGRSVRTNLEKTAVGPVAQAHFLSVEPDWREYLRLKLTWGRPADPKKFKESLSDKGRALEVVKKKYIQTVNFGAPQPALCALHRIGMAYHEMVEKVTNAPMPPGIDAETEQAIRDEFANQVQPIKAQAAEAFAAAVTKSRELDFVNDCAKESLKMLRDTYAPDMFPEVQEEHVALTKGADLVLGGDMLAAIQDVPPPVVEDEATVQAKTEAIQEDITDLTKKLREQTETDLKRPPAAAQGGTAPTKASNDDEEPEDFL
jgi:tetratricopeptide (TPR) repeat protein